MKKLSIFILIIMIMFIATLTTYTLMNQKIDESQIIKKVKTVEKATSNLTENELNEVYNIDLNGKRHRLKCNYLVTFKKNIASIHLRLYLDGFEIYSELIEDNLKTNNDDIEEIFKDEENNYLIIDESNIKILKEEKDYLLVEISSSITDLKKEYFIWNEKRNLILGNILEIDENITYKTDEETNIFYDEDKQILAKIKDNKIYALEEKEEDDATILEEYKYIIKNDKYKKELLNTYEVTIKTK